MFRKWTECAAKIGVKGRLEAEKIRYLLKDLQGELENKIATYSEFAGIMDLQRLQNHLRDIRRHTEENEERWEILCRLIRQGDDVPERPADSFEYPPVQGCRKAVAENDPGPMREMWEEQDEEGENDRKG